MKFIIAISAFLFAFATGSPTGYVVDIPAPISTQYYTQDELGRYSYGYSNQLSAKAEARSLDGSVLGSYSYLDPNGKIQSVEYTADDNGFRVAASNIPVAPEVPTPVQDTPEVLEATAKHLAAIEDVKSRAGQNDLREDLNSVEIVAAKNDVALKKDGAALAITSSVPLPTFLPITYRSTVYATPGIAIKSFVSPTVAVKAAPLQAFSYAYGINNYYSGFHYPGFTTYPATFVAGPVTKFENVEQAKGRSEGEEMKENKTS
ncbi:cuticle protein-like [Diorhabda carinulata]|uniref:cuticle protein-like n=1 Tax=Diorhabda carinulata TaxID=1163345 RepID=UPI0025A2DA87|nr:cuticle protein-like [Diorhabda carinulata]